MSKQITAVVLAAGLGTRMKSKKPKVLHAAAGRSLIEHVLHGLNGAGIGAIRLVVGFGAEPIKEHLGERTGIQFFTQKNQWGTGDAVKAADIPSLRGTVLICNGDHPLITSEDYEEAIEAFRQANADLIVVSCKVKDPLGFGRIERDPQGNIVAIVEEKDASPAQRKIHEINSGLYVVKAEALQKYLPLIKNANAKKEYYLTDLIDLILSGGGKVQVAPLSPRVVRGVNTQSELALATKALFRRKAESLMYEGVVILDPTHTYIENDVEVGTGTTIQPGVMIVGDTHVGRDCLIEAHVSLRDAIIEDNVEIRWGSIVEKSVVETGALIGPYARLRPESRVGAAAHVGNFVELKKTTLGARAKANHLTYLGDAEIGEETNIGCGVITCNYAVDRKKYKTKIGKRVFVGSDTQFVAPVTIGDDAVIASGSTITEDVPEKSLAIARGRQVNKLNYRKES